MSNTLKTRRKDASPRRSCRAGSRRRTPICRVDYGLRIPPRDFSASSDQSRTRSFCHAAAVARAPRLHAYNIYLCTCVSPRKLKYTRICRIFWTLVYIILYDNNNMVISSDGSAGQVAGDKWKRKRKVSVGTHTRAKEENIYVRCPRVGKYTSSNETVYYVTISIYV